MKIVSFSESVAKGNVVLRDKFFDVLNQRNIDMIIDVETFYEIDAVERIRVANQLMNIHIFLPKQDLVNGK
jgi:hypothetical protein